MSLSINSNIASLQAQSSYSRSQQSVSELLAELSSGSGIGSAADNPAGLAISEGLSLQSGAEQQGINNANDAIALTQTASGALSQLQTNTQQIQQLAIEAGNGALSDSNRQTLQQQVDQLTQANSQIIQSTQYNGATLLAGNGSQTFQLGNGAASQISIAASALDNSPANGGLNGYNANLTATQVIDVSTQAHALQAQTALNQDQNTLSTAQSGLGASSASLGSALNDLQTASLNTRAAQSGISSTDYAAASAALLQQQILGNASLATLSQANLSPASALSLLAGG